MHKATFKVLADLNWSASVIAFSITVSVAGCSNFDAANVSTVVVSQVSAAQSLESHTEVLSSHVSSLRRQGALYEFADLLNEAALIRSSAVQKVDVASAELAALQFERYPQVQPSASMPFGGTSEARAGISIEQTLWDGGRISGRLTDAELAVEEAKVKAWMDRNAVVYEGLEALVNRIRYAERLVRLQNYQQELENISDTLSTRFAGGVADRGESLRVRSALQEVQRRIVSDRTEVNNADSILTRLLSDPVDFSSAPSLDEALAQCVRSWPAVRTPVDLVGEIARLRAEAAEGIVEAQRMPRVLLIGGSTYTQSGWAEPSIGLQMDASDMLGFRRRDSLAAAAANVKAARAAEVLQQEEILGRVQQLDRDYLALKGELETLEQLVSESEDTLTLYNEQLVVGSIGYTDGIALYREHMDAQIARVDVKANALLNCLKSSELRGLLAPFGSASSE